MIRIAIAVLLVAVATAYLWQRCGDPPPIAPATEPAAAAQEPPSPPPKAEATAPSLRPATVSAADRTKQLELPDGSFVDALNGAENCAPLVKFWSAQRPWSPIVGVERSTAGVDWFRHADGSYSTTQMVWRKDLGRYDAMTRVAHPGPEAPGIGGATAR